DPTKVTFKFLDFEITPMLEEALGLKVSLWLRKAKDDGLGWSTPSRVLNIRKAMISTKKKFLALDRIRKEYEPSPSQLIS
ncbi:hypothetical protein HAX54_046234, partial [Datura stramonium]|nr:hypothetical protein [Datura stramonium]